MRKQSARNNSGGLENAIHVPVVTTGAGKARSPCPSTPRRFRSPGFIRACPTLACSLRQLFAFFTRGRTRHEQLQLPFRVKASRRAVLLQPGGRSR
jgi:hypothetical protein